MLNQNNFRARVPLVMALWALGVAILGASAQAESIQFNPTGASGGQVFPINGIDLAPGSVLNIGALPLTVGQTFQLDYQATVSGLIDTKGFTFGPPGLASSYQLTAVGSFTEVVQSLSPSGTPATFAVAPTQSSNSFFELYYNPALVANNLAGTGFNQGTLILAGKPDPSAPSIGVFSLSTGASGPTIVPFDQYISNHYPNITTVAGSGAAMLSADITFFDPAFFKTPISKISFNSSLVTPFQQVSPSGLFTGLPGGGAPTIVPDIGTVNGVNGRDFQQQADANFSFGPSPIPEPASIIQASLGLLAVLGLAAWTRR